MDLHSAVEDQLQTMERTAVNTAAVLSDPVSEVSRKWQLWLLGTSLLCILLNAKVATVSRVSFLGLDLNPEGAAAVFVSLKWVCAYFSIVYIAHLYQDLKLAHYKAMPHRAELIRIGLELNDRNSREMAQVAAGQERLADISEEFTEIVARSRIAMKKEDQLRLLALPMLANTESEKIREATAKLDGIITQTLIAHRVERMVQIVRLVIQFALPVGLAVFAVFAPHT